MDVIDKDMKAHVEWAQTMLALEGRNTCEAMGAASDAVEDGVSVAARRAFAPLGSSVSQAPGRAASVSRRSITRGGSGAP